jgi:hypothetical protein
MCCSQRSAACFVSWRAEIKASRVALIALSSLPAPQCPRASGVISGLTERSSIVAVSPTFSVNLMLVDHLTGLDQERMPSLVGQRRIYKERASSHDLPEQCAGSSSLIANSARLRQTSSPRRKFAACDFSAPGGGSSLPFRPTSTPLNYGASSRW